MDSLEEIKERTLWLLFEVERLIWDIKEAETELNQLEREIEDEENKEN